MTKKRCETCECYDCDCEECSCDCHHNDRVSSSDNARNKDNKPNIKISMSSGCAPISKIFIKYPYSIFDSKIFSAISFLPVLNILKIALCS